MKDFSKATPRPWISSGNWIGHKFSSSAACLATNIDDRQLILMSVNNFERMTEALNRVVEDSESEDYFGGISNATFKEIKQLLESIK